MSRAFAGVKRLSCKYIGGAAFYAGRAAALLGLMRIAVFGCERGVMRLGFLGTGAISDAVIRGLCGNAERERSLSVKRIIISPRNAVLAAKLAHDFSCVEVAADNQELVNTANIVFVALPGAVCEAELRKLRFKVGQKLVSFVPNASCAMLRGWLNVDLPIARAVPLPFVAKQKTATPIFPADKDLQALFGAIGGFIAVEEEKQFDLFMTGGSLMGLYYRFASLCGAWLEDKGLPAEQAKFYIASLFNALGERAAGDGAAVDFAALQCEYSTKGGTNELIAAAFDAAGGADALKNAINQGFDCITGKCG